MIDKPIGPLRQRMIEDMTVRRFQAATQQDYIRHVKRFRAGRGIRTATAVQEAQSVTICGPPQSRGEALRVRRGRREG